MENTTLSGVLDERTILTNFKAENKDEVIKKVAQLFYDAGYVASADDFVDAVYDREKQGATGIGNHVAIPHGKSTTVKKNGVAIITLDHEIDWESLDDTGARVVVVFAVGDDSEGAKEHLRMLAFFAKQLAKQEVIDKLLAAKDVQDVMNCFKD